MRFLERKDKNLSSEAGNGRARVALVGCAEYHYPEVRQAVARGLQLLGGLDHLVRPGERIVLKPNLLAPDPPEKCVTTHPAVFKAMAENLQRTGVKVSFGDSPAVGSTALAARRAGLTAVADELGLERADFSRGEEMSFSEGKQNKRFTIAKGVLESDGLISLPKLKTHGLTRMTGAIKNQFGCIPGLLKSEFHVKMPDADNFTRMLIDLNLLLKPRLYVMDGIWAMEGNGPRGGTPRHMGVLLFSTDPVALDATVCRLVNLPPEDVPMLTNAQQMGLGTYQMENIDLLGDRWEGLAHKDFMKPDKAGTSIQTPWLRNRIIPKPFIDPRRCIQCGICIQGCPVKPAVVDWENEDKTKPPIYDYRRCIRCYCCQEMCPEAAIELRAPWLGKVLAPLVR
ncbi:MAG: DUF362 domain-containing protein [Syntrophomonadaceae bacterium]|nr:DUF362 domain-containing protein [Syntrophomonadaceae bacterium]